MKIISSRQNPDFKKLKAIASESGARRRDRLAWLEGDRLCQAYLDALHRQIKDADQRNPKNTVFFRPPVLVTTPDRSSALEATYGSLVSDLWVLDAPCFRGISQVDSPSGWGLMIPIPVMADDLSDLTTASEFNCNSHDVVVLDRIADPGNAGAIIRSAAAAGIRFIWCITPHVDMWSPKVLRSAMGGHFALSIMQEMPEADVLAALSRQKSQLLATALTHESMSLYSPALDLKRPSVWVFGQEAHGVSASILKQAQAVRIPQEPSVESLNVAASAAVCLFEMRRQRLTQAG
jgi:RNA methyltransferase, TrmH family